MWIAGLIALVVVVGLVLLILFEPGLRYKVLAPEVPLDSDEYLSLLGALADAEVHDRSSIEVLPNGDTFYEAEIEAIKNARRHVNLEAYIFYKSEIAKRFVDALTERARAGVKVKLVLDYIGSFSTPNSLFHDLRAAGGEVCWYQPIRWYTFKRFNNRTHRELLIVDGEVGFIGGAGIDDVWYRDQPKKPRWRDTVFRVRGALVSALQSTFAENWLESSEEILARSDYFPTRLAGETNGDLRGMVINSSPSAGRGTRARVVFQTLLASATRTIDIVSPYFLPDRSTRREMIKAVKERNVRVRVLTPGRHADHAMTRSSSRRRYGELLENGVEIHEYQPAMIHEKMLVIDGVWSVIGSTNFDNRSFGINDEVNLAALDEPLARRLIADFENDLQSAELITLEKWKRRPLSERLLEWAGWILERQQ